MVLKNNLIYSSTSDLLPDLPDGFTCFTALNKKITCIANLQIPSNGRFKEKDKLVPTETII